MAKGRNKKKKNNSETLKKKRILKIKGRKIIKGKNMKKENLALESKKKRKIKHIRTILILLMILFLTLICFVAYSFSKYKYEKNQEELRIAREQRIKEKIEEISKNYNKAVKTNKDASIYSLNDDEYTKVGSLGENIVLSLDDIDIDEDTLYFPITDFKNKYYISYEDVIPFTEEVKNLDSRYKNYIPFNKSVQTNTTKLYKDDVLLYDIPESYTFPIYIMEKDKYYVEFNNELLYVLNDSNILKVFDNKNSDAKKATSIGTILYHFIYDPSNDSCNEVICQSTTQVQQHIDFFKKNNYFTLTMKEFEMFIDGKINVPQNSFLITLDDGAHAQTAKKIFTDNKMNATFFIVSSWFNPKDFETEYVEVHSHTDNLHRTGACPNSSQGGPLTCEPREKLLADLKLSREKTNMTTAISYPFYEYNDYTISVVKEAGFTLGFAGLKSGGSMKAYVGYDKFRIPRITILNDTTVMDLDEIF